MSNNKLEVTGHLLDKGELFESTTSDFKKLPFRLAIREEVNGSSWLETPEFILVNDKIGLLDSAKAGDKLTVKFSLAGRESKGKVDTSKVYKFTELKAFDVVVEKADTGVVKGGKTDAVTSDPRLLEPTVSDTYDDLPFS